MGDHKYDRGLVHDLNAMLERRQFLRWAVVGVGALPFVGCSSDSMTSTDAATDGNNFTCAKIPEETAGPYPADGSNGPNVLTQSGIVRSDIRSSFGTATGIATGVPLTVTLTIVNSNASCVALSSYAVYLWHCDAAGRYSLYTSGATGENYLRGVQATGSDGKATFTTVFPACYSGRWPHIHFEVYPSLAAATASGTKIATSQLALPQADCQTVYATSGYPNSTSNLAQVSLATDNVFSDGATTETPTVTGSVAAGYAAALTVPVAA